MAKKSSRDLTSLTELPATYYNNFFIAKSKIFQKCQIKEACFQK